jgi:hypothetical protein
MSVGSHLPIFNTTEHSESQAIHGRDNPSRGIYLAGTGVVELLYAGAPPNGAVFSKQALRYPEATAASAGGRPKDGTLHVSIGITVDVTRLHFKAAHVATRNTQQTALPTTQLGASSGFSHRSGIDYGLGADQRKARIPQICQSQVVLVHKRRRKEIFGGTRPSIGHILHDFELIRPPAPAGG